MPQSSSTFARPIVVALGGNALQRPGDQGSWTEQAARAAEVAPLLVGLPAPGGLVLTHGNGPQVGVHLLRSDLLRDRLPPTRLDVAVAATQGEIGWVLQRALGAALARAGDPRSVLTLLTQVVVDAQDPAFQDPTKFVGTFFSEEEALRAAAELGWRVKRDANRGFRRVVPSPAPREIVEAPAVSRLLQDGGVVIAGGGGGVPVIRRGGQLIGVEAVVDKDLTAALLARQIQAASLMILTGVDQVWLRFGTPQAQPLGVVRASEMAGWLAEGHFPPGSMGPKIAAALDFLAHGGSDVIITSPDALPALASGGPHTRICADR